VGEEETYLWSHRRQNDLFSYRVAPYKRFPSSFIHVQISPAYQVFPWFAVLFTLSHQVETGGWTEESGFRVALPERSLGTFSSGFEILVSPTVRFSQYFHLPVYGRENYALFSFRTGLSINLITLKNLYY